jgi:antitoxin component YwqK of YwqJK toxin-antitoxin module
MRATLPTGALLCLSVVLVGCSQPNGNYEALANKGVRCPDGSHLEYLPWSKSGLRAVCLMENGPVAMAENGRVVIEGQYAMGKQVGEWRWFDASGNITRSERHDSAKP